MPSGGDIIEITYNNANIGSGVFFPKSAEDSTYDTGGARTSDDNNMICGNGTAIYQQNLQRPSFAVKIAWFMGGNDDSLATLSALTTDPNETAWTFTNINGVIHKLTGKQVGDLTGNGNTSTIDLKVAGSGVLQII